MKVTNYASAVAFALLYSSEVSAVQLKEIVSQYVPEENIYVQWGTADDIAYSDYDKEYQPDSFAQQMQTDMYKAPFGRKIIDKDGDGVEDNQHKTQEELDRFRKPVYHPVEDIHNTRHGNLPGHVNEGFHPEPQSLIQKDGATKLQSEIEDIDSGSFYDKSYLQTEESSSQDLMTKFIDIVDSPEALNDENLIQFRPQDLKHAHKPWAIYDADGDGVEDNVHLTHEELDAYYKPNVFFPTENIYNTRHGNLPGHIQKGYYDIQKEPESMDLVKHDWKKW